MLNINVIGHVSGKPCQHGDVSFALRLLAAQKGVQKAFGEVEKGHRAGVRRFQRALLGQDAG